MSDLNEYVEGLFRRQRLTPEVEDLKEEILSNMTAKRDDLIARGIDAELAAEKAKESLSSIDGLIDANQLTDLSQYRLACAQTVLLHSILYWIFSLPLLFTQFAGFNYLGLFLTAGSGILFLFQGKQPAGDAAFLSTASSERRTKTVWIVWGLFFAVCAGTTAALLFASDIWFGRPVTISGPSQMANLAARIYLPLLTILIPITCGGFTRLLIKNRKGASK